MKLNDPIELYTLFKAGKIIPVAFKWHQDMYKIEKINLSYEEKNGQYKKFIYSVSIHDTIYKISLNEKDRECRLCAIETIE